MCVTIVKMQLKSKNTKLQGREKNAIQTIMQETGGRRAG